MKCVIHEMTNSSEVKRVSNEQAIVLVATGKWDFCPKSAYKEDPNTKWVKASVPANPMKDSKLYRQQKRNFKKTA